MLIQQRRQPTMLSHRVSLTPACMGTGWSLCDSCVYPCVCCPWDSLSPASRRTLPFSTCSALAQPLLAIRVGSLYPTMCQGFKNSAFPLTYLLPTPSLSRVFLPLVTGWSLHSSSGASRTIVWRSSQSSAWAPFRLLSTVAL